MGKIIDFYLDLPSDVESTLYMLKLYCLGAGNTTSRSYKKTFGNKVANQIGFDINELDQIAQEKGADEFERIVREAAVKNLMSLDEFVDHLDDLGVEWGFTSTFDHNSEKTAEIVKKYPEKFKGFSYVDPNIGLAKSVQKLEHDVKDLGLKAAYITAFRTKLPANDKRFYPIYAKSVELNIPVFIYSSMNLSTAVPMDIGHPRYIDEVARDFPELKIMGAVGGWPWMLELAGVAMRHSNVYINMEVNEPAKLNIENNGFEGLMHYASTLLQDKFCFASNWNVQGLTLKALIDQVYALPISDEIRDKWFYQNGVAFMEK